jgi:very-short-patch-repair endonuclease
MPARSAGWGGLFKGEQYRLIRNAAGLLVEEGNPACSVASVKPERVRNQPSNKRSRQTLRNSLTAAEAVLWNCLKQQQLSGKKFRRQAGVGRYIVDFLCPECGLVIELDGDAHFSPNADQFDDPRTKYLEKQGLRVIRFENNEIAEDLNGVLETIRANLNV